MSSLFWWRDCCTLPWWMRHGLCISSASKGNSSLKKHATANPSRFSLPIFSLNSVSMTPKLHTTLIAGQIGHGGSRCPCCRGCGQQACVTGCWWGWGDRGSKSQKHPNGIKRPRWQLFWKGTWIITHHHCPKHVWTTQPLPKSTKVLYALHMLRMWYCLVSYECNTNKIYATC